MITSTNLKARDWMNIHYNIDNRTPSCFLDGGDGVLVGETAEQPYHDMIEASGARVVPPLDLKTRMVWHSNSDIEVTVRLGNGVSANGVAQPNAPVGPNDCQPETYYLFQATADDPEGDSLYYQWVWNEGDTGIWVGPFESGFTTEYPVAWSADGNYQVRVRTRDIWDDVSNWSEPKYVTVSCCSGTVGNLDGVGEVDGIDLSILLDHLFINLTPLECLVSGDMDWSGQPDPEPFDVNGVDLSVMLDHLFINLTPMRPCP